MGERLKGAPTTFWVIVTAIRQLLYPPTAVGCLPPEYVVEGSVYRDPRTEKIWRMTGRADQFNCVKMQEVGDPGSETVLDLTNYVAIHRIRFLSFILTAKFWAMRLPD